MFFFFSFFFGSNFGELVFFRRNLGSHVYSTLEIRYHVCDEKSSSSYMLSSIVKFLLSALNRVLSSMNLTFGCFVLPKFVCVNC